MISIIVPCFNVQEYLGDCILSIINQTFSDWELILVDDGSTDNTPVICDNYSKQDTRIKTIHKVNGGLVSARNAGFNAISGEWHMYIDGDDWIDYDTCEKLNDIVQKYEGVDIVFWKCIQELGDKSIKGKWEWPCTDSEHLYKKQECLELSRNTLVYKSGIATAYCKLIKTEYAQKNKIYHDVRLRQGAEGLEFSLRAFYYAKKALYVNAYYNHYRFVPNSISKKIDEKNTKFLVDCLNVIREDINSFPQKNVFWSSFYQRISYILIAIAMSTYFHPANEDPIWTKIRKYSSVIKSNEVFKLATIYATTEGMDKQRKLTWFFIKNKIYIALSIASQLKQYYLQKGKYNY